MSPLVSGPDGPASSPGEASDRVSPAEALLLASVFLIAACGLAYELAAGWEFIGTQALDLLRQHLADT